MTHPINNSIQAAALTLCVDVYVLSQFLPYIRNVDADLKERRADQKAHPHRTYDSTVIRFEVRMPRVPALVSDDVSICPTKPLPFQTGTPHLLTPTNEH